MYEPRVEFYNLYISLFPTPTDLQVHCSNLLVNGYVFVKYERYPMKNGREILEQSLFYSVSLWPWPLTYVSENVYN